MQRIAIGITSCICLMVTGAIADPVPGDEVELLSRADQKPQINLVIDYSCAMSSGWGPSECAWFRDTYDPGAGRELNRRETVHAVLTGCNADDDGVIDRWGDLINFQVRPFSKPPEGQTGFDSVTDQPDHSPSDEDVRSGLTIAITGGVAQRPEDENVPCKDVDCGYGDALLCDAGVRSTGPIIIIGIGIASDARDEYVSFAEQHDGRFISIRTADELSSTLETLLEEMAEP